VVHPFRIERIIKMAPMLFAVQFWQAFFGIGMFSSAVFLILLVLVQRGRGGGLAGALGGMGGQSAFGTKAGDTFTKLTIVVASLWIVLSMAAVVILGQPSANVGGVDQAGSIPAAVTTSDTGLPGTDPVSGDSANVDDPVGGAQTTQQTDSESAGADDDSQSGP
jgi:preprotein translocase subunit SecG